MAFQTTLNAQAAPGVEGDFCSSNPRYSMLAGPGALTAGAAGVAVGRFAWALNDNDATAPGVVSNGHPGRASRLGFAGRDNRALITVWLGQASMVVPQGLEITLFSGADVFARFAAGATIDQKVFASYFDGSAIAGALGVPPTDNAFRVTTVNASAVLTITTAGAEPISPGMPVAGAGVPVGAYVVSLGTSTGGLGTVTISAAATASAAAVVLTATLAQETPWYVNSTAGNGELAKIATRP